MKFVYCSISTVIDPENSLSQSGMFCEVIETGINILNRDFFSITTHFLLCFYTSNQSSNLTF